VSNLKQFEGPLKFSKFFLSVKFETIRGSAQIFQILHFYARVRSNFSNFAILCEGPLKFSNFALLCEGPLKFFKFFKYCTKSKNNDFRHLEKISNPISTVGILGKFFENSCQQGLGRSQNCDSVAIYGLRPCSRSL
jgi:hypothetical protein